MATFFLIKKSSLNSKKLFVEYYLPEYQALFEKMYQGPYPVKSLGEISKRIFDGPFGSNRKVDMYQDSGIPYIRVKDVLPEGIVEQGLTYISPEKHKDLYRSRVTPGNVLMTIAGRLGTAVVFPEHLVEGNITGHIAGLELPNTVNPYYIAIAINSSVGQFQVERWGHRTTRPELNIQEIRQIMIPLPPRPIQDQIALVMQDAYTKQEEKLATSKEMLERIESYVLAKLGIRLSQLENNPRVLKPVSSIAGGRFDFEATVALRNLDFNSVSSTALRKLGQLITERVTPAAEMPNEDVNYISLGHIASMTGTLTEFSPVKGLTVLSASTKFKKGDILFGRMRPYLNKVWVAEFDGVCTGEAVVFRPNLKKVNTQFLHSLLLSQVTLHQVVPLQSGTSLPRVSPSDILNVQLPIPEKLDLQLGIAQEVAYRRKQALQLMEDASTIVSDAKAYVERIILGEEMP